MFSNTGKLHEFISPNTTTKKMYDQYQRDQGCDLWSTHYKNMQENLRKLKEVNNRLRREIRRRVGTDDMSDLTQNELCALEQKMEDSITVVRERKYHVIKTQTDTCRKKVRNLEERHGNLLLDFEAKCQVDPRYASVDDDDKGYDDSTVSFANGVSNLYAFHLHHSLHHGGAAAGFGCHDLRLA